MLLNIRNRKFFASPLNLLLPRTLCLVNYPLQLCEFLLGLNLQLSSCSCPVLNQNTGNPLTFVRRNEWINPRLVDADFTDALTEGWRFICRIKFNNFRIKVQLWLLCNFCKLFTRDASILLKGLQSFLLFFLKENASSSLSPIRLRKVVCSLRVWKFIKYLLKFFAINVIYVRDYFNTIAGFM